VVTYHVGQVEAQTSFAVHRIPKVPTYRKLSPGPSYQKLFVLDPLLAWKLFEVIRKHRIDIIHAHHYEGLMVSLAVSPLCNLEIVYDAHTMLESELPYYRVGIPMFLKRCLGRHLDRWLPRRASHVATVTEHIRAKLIREGALDPQRVTTLPSGVNCAHFDIAEPAVENRNGIYTVLFTGNLAAYQGIDLLLAAFAEVVDKRKDVRLKIVSDSSFAPYEDLAKQLGVRDRVDMIFSSFDALPRHLAAADVAVNPRVYCDGIPVKLLNYMAARKPVVSFAGSAKFLTHGERGWVVPDGDVLGFADGILRLLADPKLARGLGQRAREFAETELSWAGTARRAEELYRNLLRGRLQE
jgi:glycosyltransferase involved in cell wall biosynthesis